jgi:MraZ protein
MLLGTHEHTIDDKNRLTLPAKFRQAFADGLVVTRGFERCLFAYRREDWQRRIESRIAALDSLSEETRKLERFVFSGAAEAELDKQGRLMLPSHLIEHAGLGREVVIAGVNDRIEIWDRAAWRTELAEVEGRAEHVAERLATRRD